MRIKTHTHTYTASERRFVPGRDEEKCHGDLFRFPGCVRAKKHDRARTRTAGAPGGYLRPSRSCARHKDSSRCYEVTLSLSLLFSRPYTRRGTCAELLNSERNGINADDDDDDDGDDDDGGNGNDGRRRWKKRFCFLLLLRKKGAQTPF